MTGTVIRRAEARDLPALLAIYNHYVVNTHVTFDIEPRTLVERKEWLDGFAETGRHRCFVAARDGTAIGWACSAKFKEKAAYRTSVETSVYLSPGEEGQGLGRRLYETLIESLKGEDVHRLLAGIAQPNLASVALTRRWASATPAPIPKSDASSAASGTSDCM